MTVHLPQNPTYSVNVNFILNASFEASVAGTGGPPPHWAGPTQNQVTTQFAHSGLNSIVMFSLGQCQQNVSVAVNGVTELSFWVLGNGGAGQIIVDYTDATNTTVAILGTAAWAKNDITASLSAGKTIKDVNLIGFMVNPWWLDDVSLTAPSTVQLGATLFYPPQA